MYCINQAIILRDMFVSQIAKHFGNQYVVNNNDSLYCLSQKFDINLKTIEDNECTKMMIDNNNTSTTTNSSNSRYSKCMYKLIGRETNVTTMQNNKD